MNIRILYLVMATGLALAWRGVPAAEKLVAEFPVAVVLFAAGTAANVVAAVIPRRPQWIMAYVATCAALVYRAMASMIIEVFRDHPIGGRENLLFLVLGVYLIALVGVWALYSRVLRPEGPHA